MQEMERELLVQLTKLSQATASARDLEEQRWVECRADLDEFRGEFRYVRDQLSGVFTAVTRTATDLELITQQVRPLTESVKELERRVGKLESGRALERGAWAVIVVLATAVGATLTALLPNWIPTISKGPN